MREASCTKICRTWSEGSLSRLDGDIAADVATISSSRWLGRVPCLLSKIVSCVKLGQARFRLWTDNAATIRPVMAFVDASERGL